MSDYCQEYDRDSFIGRPQTQAQIQDWAASNSPVIKRALCIVAAPGWGKTWVMKDLANQWQAERFVAYLDVSTIVNSGSSNTSTLINEPAFYTWFHSSVLEHLSKHGCVTDRFRSEIPDLQATISEFIEFLCNCKLKYPPLFIIDGYDEITEVQAREVSLHILERLLEQACTRVLIARRPETRLIGDSLRRNSQTLMLSEFDPVDDEFLLGQIEKVLEKYHASVSIADVNKWRGKLKHYRWNHPLANRILLHLGLKNGLVKPLTEGDIRDCCRLIIERRDKQGIPRYLPVSKVDMRDLYDIATKIGI
jgi:hypothetical protein